MSEHAYPPPTQGARTGSRWSLAAGPMGALLIYGLLPEQLGEVVLTDAGRLTAATAGLMAIWWLTEALPLPATALLPMGLFPLMGIADFGAAAAPYANPVIFLFMGGFILGLAMERWALHRRFAMAIVARVGVSPNALTGGFMLATAGLSMWVSNTAAAIILLPVGLSVVTMLRQRLGTPAAAEIDRFSTGLILAIAYGASIGGVATLIGSPPNLVLAGYAREHLGCEISMLRWMSVGLPVAAVMLPLAWLYLTRLAYRARLDGDTGLHQWVHQTRTALGPWTPGERVVMTVFSLTALAWIIRPLLAEWLGLPGLTDAGIAIVAALLLFVLPVKGSGMRAMDWETASRLPWGILILFGGGLSLAAAVASTGVDRYLAAAFTGAEGLPPWVILLMVTTLVIFLTELTSNTAVANTFIPIVAAVATGLGLPVIPVLMAVAIAASFAFMLPVATPPNAVVFSSGLVGLRQMARTGVVLNIVGVGVVVVAMQVLGSAACP